METRPEKKGPTAACNRRQCLKMEKNMSESSIPAELVERRNEIARRLKAAGFEYVTLRFSGCGDEGQLDDVETVPDLSFTRNLQVDLEDFGEDYMMESGVNWFDNNGGGGRISFDLKNGTFDSDVWWNEIVSETGFCEESIDLDLTATNATAEGNEPPIDTVA